METHKTHTIWTIYQDTAGRHGRGVWMRKRRVSEVVSLKKKREEGVPERQVSGGSIDCRRSWSLSWWDLSVSPCAQARFRSLLPPHRLYRRIFFHWVYMQRWAVSALVLPYCKRSRPCRISINHQRVACLCPPPPLPTPRAFCSHG